MPTIEEQVTQLEKQVGALSATVKEFKSVEQTINALNEKLASGGSLSERMEAVEKQLADAQRINEGLQRQRKGLPVFSDDVPPGETLIKGIQEGMPEKQAQAVLNKVVATPTQDDTIHDFQVWSDRLKILCGYLNKQPHELKCFKEYTAFTEKTGLGKALSVAGSPSNWVPEAWSAEMWLYYQQTLKVADLFFEFEMPQDPFQWPFLGSGFTLYLRGEPTADPASKIRASDPSQSVVTFTTSELAGRIVLSRKLTEDAIMEMMTVLRERLIPRAMAEAEEKAIVNGDDSATHQDTALVTASDDVRKAFKGIRKLAQAASATYDVTTDSTAFAYTDFAEVLKKAGKYASNPDEGAWVFGNTAYYSTLALDPHLTAEKTNLPTNINGVVNRILGFPVVVSGEYPETLDSSGLGTSGGSKSGFTFANRSQIVRGYRRDYTIESDKDIETGQEIMVCSMRKDMQNMAGSGEAVCASGTNVS